VLLFVIKKFKLKIFLYYAFLFVLCVSPFFFKSINSDNAIIKNELYNPKLNAINTIDKSIIYIDSIYKVRNSSTLFDTALYVHTVSYFVKSRFYHGLSSYSFSENWIATISGNLLWSHFSAIVDPEDLLKHSEGLCSQQSIVF